MSCKIPADLTNKVESNFYNKLLEIFDGDESRATESYSFIRTPEFLDIFGNYSEAMDKKYIPPSMSDRLDEQTFEPLLFYDANLNKYYVKSATNDRLYYPFGTQGLEGFFAVNEIREFAKSLAFSYYDTHLKLNVDTMEFENLTGTTLKDFIEEFIETTGDNLYDADSAGKVALGGDLLDSAKYIEEWVNEVKSIYNTFKLDIVQETEDTESQMQEREEEVNDLMRPESFLKDSKDNVNNNVKLYLSLLKGDKENMFGLSKFVEFGDIYTSLNKSLVDMVSTIDINGHPEDLFEEYKEKILKLGEVKPYFKGLYDLLDKEIGNTEVGRAQIVSAFKLAYQQYIGTETIKDDDGVITTSVKNLSETSSRRKNLLFTWNHNFRRTLIDSDRVFTSPINEFKKSSADFVRQKKSITTIEQLLPFIDTLQKDFERLGVIFNSEGKLSGRDLSKEADIQKGLLYFIGGGSLESTTLEEKKDNIFEAYDSVIRGLDRFASKLSTNIFSDQGVFTKLADAEAFFQEEGSDASINTVGKTKWAYSLPSYLSEKINSWKKHPELMFHHFMSTEYNKGSFYMRYLLGIDKENISNMTFEYWENNFKEASIRNIAELEIFNFNSVQAKGDAANAKDGKSISVLDAVVDYANKVLAFKKGAKVYHKTGLAADKSTEYQPHYGNALSINTHVTRFDHNTESFNFSTEVEEILFEYFKADYTRMGTEMAFRNTNLKNNPEKLIGNYHFGTSNAFSSQLFPSLTPTFKEVKDENGEKVLEAVLPEDPDLRDLYDSVTGEAHLASLSDYKDVIIEKIVKQLSENVNAVHTQLVEDGVFVLNEEGFLSNVGLDTHIFESYKKAELYDGMATKTLAADFLVNSIVSQVEYSKMFTGDVAYYKNPTDYKKRVPASYTDGLYLYITDPKDVNFNAAVVDSIEVPVPYLDNLYKLLGEEAGGPTVKYYEDVNAADAQAWITPGRWKFIKRKLGKWTSKDDILYDKLSDPTAEFSPEELKKLAQPLKGVYFEIVDGIPRYLKYSQAVLVPKLIAGTELQILHDKMTLDTNGKELEYSDQIHEVITKDGFKVGYPTPDVIHDAKGDLLPDVTLTKIPLLNQGWKLQQDLSPKGWKSTELGSQIMKVIFQGLEFNLDKTFIVGETEMTGDALIEHINEIISDLSDRGIQKVMAKLGVDPDTFKITNEEAMVASMISDLKKRPDTADNTIKALLAGTSPYGIAGQSQIFQNVFSSAINKAAVKVRTNGGSFIQMADFGISKTEASKKENGIRFTPWMKDSQSKLHTPESYIDAEGRKRVRPGGVFVSGSFIAKYVPNYRQLSDKELFGTYNSTTEKYEKGVIDEKILKNIVGYRIPNQGLPSNDAFHIMGILPEDTADTIIAYTGITAKTGSDFDIDKMYVMMPSFNPVTNLKSEAFKTLMDNFRGDSISATIDNLAELAPFVDLEVDKEELATMMSTDKGRRDALKYLQKDLVAVILDSDNANLPIVKDIKNRFDVKVTRLQYIEPSTELIDDVETELPMHEQTLGAVQNKLIEAYVAVLASPHTIKDVMKPIDEPFAEDDIKNMYPEVKRPDMMDFDAYTDVKLKEEFKLGKAGLGQNVNALVDAVRGGMAHLTLNKVYLGRGNSATRKQDKDEFTETLFDQEYSDELSDKELKEYVESFNQFSPDAPITLEDAKALSKIKISDAMKALVNGFVDIAKDPFITRGGWVTQTNNVGFLLVRAGIHPFYINAFLGQPIIKEYVNFVNKNESITVSSTDQLKERFLIRKGRQVFTDKFGIKQIKINGKNINSQVLYDKVVDVYTKYKYEQTLFKKGGTPELAKREVNTLVKGKLNKAFGFRTNAVGETVEEREEFNTLQEEITEAITTILSIPTSNTFSEYSIGKLRSEIKDKTLEDQIKLINSFYELIPLAKSLTASVRGSKADTDGKGKNIGSLIVANNFVRDIIKKEVDDVTGTLRGFASKLQYNEKDTFLNTIFKNSILTPYKIMRANPKYFLTAQDSVIHSFNYISDNMYNERLQNQELADKLEKAHYSYIMSGFRPLQLTKEEKRKLMDELPDKLMELKADPRYKDNVFVHTLYVKEGEERGYIAMPGNKKTVTIKNSLTDGWREVLDRNPEIGEDLIKYSFVISGFNMSMNQFHDFIPYQWFNKNLFNSYLKTTVPPNGELDRQFLDQFYRNNYEASTTKSLRENDYYGIPGISSRDAIQIDADYMMKGNRSFPHFVKIAEEEANTEEAFFGGGATTVDAYYKFVGQLDANGVYVRTSPLGYMDTEGNKIVEYNSLEDYNNENELESIVHGSPIDLKKVVGEINAYAEANETSLSFVTNEYLAVDNDNTVDIVKLLNRTGDNSALVNMMEVDINGDIITEDTSDNGPTINTIVNPNKNKPFKNSLFRGMRDIKINKKGELVLNPSYDNLFKGDGVSFADTSGHAATYASKYSSNSYVVEVDRDYLAKFFKDNPQGGSKAADSIVLGEEGEQRIVTSKVIKIPSDKFNVISEPQAISTLSIQQLADLYKSGQVDEELMEESRIEQIILRTDSTSAKDEEIKQELLKRGVTEEELIFFTSDKYRNSPLNMDNEAVNNYYNSTVKIPKLESLIEDAVAFDVNPTEVVFDYFREQLIAKYTKEDIGTIPWDDPNFKEDKDDPFKDECPF